MFDLTAHCENSETKLKVKRNSVLVVPVIMQERHNEVVMNIPLWWLKV